MAAGRLLTLLALALALTTGASAEELWRTQHTTKLRDQAYAALLQQHLDWTPEPFDGDGDHRFREPLTAEEAPPEPLPPSLAWLSAEALAALRQEQSPPPATGWREALTADGGDLTADGGDLTADDGDLTADDSDLTADDGDLTADESDQTTNWPRGRFSDFIYI